MRSRVLAMGGGERISSATLRRHTTSDAAPTVLRPSSPRKRLTREIAAGILAGGDVVALVLAGSLFLAFGPQAALMPWAAILSGLAFLLISWVAGDYAPHGRVPMPVGTLLAWLGGAGGCLALLALAEGMGASDLSGAWTGVGTLGAAALWLGGTAVLLLLWREWLRHRMVAWRRGGHLVTRVAVVGADARCAALITALTRDSEASGVECAGIYDDAPIPTALDSAVLAPVVLGGIRVTPLGDLLRDVAADRVDGVVIAVAWDDAARVRALCSWLPDLVVDVWLLADPDSPAAQARGAMLVGGVKLLEVWRRPLGGWRGVTKRAEDLVIGSVLLLLCLPVMLLTAAAVALGSRGPVLLRQRRFGYGSSPFQIYKFRTMYYDESDLSGARATVKGDKRVTRVGRFLRASSLDELPQLLNVLRGEMSLVGPRPHPVEMLIEGVYYEDLVEEYLSRHRMKPGITGMAQISGSRGLVDTREKAQRRVDLDLHYIENWSLALDLRILWQTALKGFFNTGAS